MQIGKWLLTKHNGVVVKGIVIEFFSEDINIKLDDGTIIQRKYWEVRSAPYDNEKEER